MCRAANSYRWTAAWNERCRGLIWQLTGGEQFVPTRRRLHATFFDLAAQRWTRSCWRRFRLAESALPAVVGNAEVFGADDPRWFGLEIDRGTHVDQQAASLDKAASPARARSPRHRLLRRGWRAASTPRARAQDCVASVGWRLAWASQPLCSTAAFTAPGSLVDWLCSLGLATNAAGVAVSQRS